MQTAKDIPLDSLSVRELLELQASIHAAIRAAIREKNARLSGGIKPPIAEAAPKRDLARERDAWLAARRRTG